MGSPRRPVAPAASAILLPGPKPAPRASGLWAAGPTRCGGSAARPRGAPMSCRSCPAGPGCGSSRAKLPLSPGSPRAASESSSATRPSAWISATGRPRWRICPSSQVRESRLGPGEVPGRGRRACGRGEARGPGGLWDEEQDGWKHRGPRRRPRQVPGNSVTSYGGKGQGDPPLLREAARPGVPASSVCFLLSLEYFALLLVSLGAHKRIKKSGTYFLGPDGAFSLFSLKGESRSGGCRTLGFLLVSAVPFI